MLQKRAMRERLRNAHAFGLFSRLASADICYYVPFAHYNALPIFIADAAAAEVLIRGCCSKLNHTKHHLASAEPPPLVTTMNFRAEIMSQTVQNGQVKTRVMFCNTLGCNNQRVPWSKPVPYIPVVSKDPPWSLPHDDNEVELEQHPMHTRMNRRQSLAEEQSLLAFVEKMRTTGNQNLMQRPKMPLLNAKLDPIARKRPLVTRKEERRYVAIIHGHNNRNF
jgi:hypothetical protein